MNAERKERVYSTGSRSLRNAFAFFDDTDTHIDFIRLVHDGEGVSGGVTGSIGIAKNVNSSKGGLVLEGYFNDLYKLFVRKLAQFECQAHIGEEERARLKNLLDELVRVKGMLCESEE